ncbi:MAG: hypothetical protein WBX26_05445 [Candidatus Cybelea sp.]
MRSPNFTLPFLFVKSVSKGVPGRGLDVDFGVDSSTGILGLGEPLIVTKTCATVTDGLGEGEEGVKEGVGVVELLL